MSDTGVVSTVQNAQRAGTDEIVRSNAFQREIASFSSLLDPANLRRIEGRFQPWSAFVLKSEIRFASNREQSRVASFRCGISTFLGPAQLSLALLARSPRRCLVRALQRSKLEWLQLLPQLDRPRQRRRRARRSLIHSGLAVR